MMNEIGPTLRTARQEQRLDLAACEQETKIRTRYLEAMERGNFDELPGPVYTRGFLRSYAGLLKLDGQALVDAYNLQLARQSGEIPSTSDYGASRRVGMMLVTLLIAVGAAGAAALYLLS